MRKFSLVCVVFIAFFCLCPVANALEWKELHEKADAMTLAEARSAQEKEPDSQEALYLLGLALLNEYKISEAWNLFERMEPGRIEARWGKAEVLRRRHELDEAEKMLEAVILDDPSYAPAPISLGYMLLDKGEYERAIRLANKVLGMGRQAVDSSNYARAYLIIGGAKATLADKGGIFSKIFQGTQVLGYFKKAQSLQPHSAGVLYGLGSFYALAPGIAGGDVDKGLAYLRQAIQADPCFVDAYARLAQVWLKQGDRGRYESYMKKAEELDPKDPLVMRVRQMGL
ncbi:MAG: tetratricopeptide repeat protein [Candidatus Omnitrophota bacterium]